MRVRLKLIYTICLQFILLFKYCKNDDKFQSNVENLFSNIFLLVPEPTTPSYGFLKPPFNFGLETQNIFDYNNGNSAVVEKVQPKTRGASTVHKESVQEASSSIRLRLNEPFFQETARLFYGVFSYEVKNIHIMPQQQCFQEGCFNLHSFRITGFQRPRGISLKPLPPNLLMLNIIFFDVDILGLLNGNIHLLLTAVPVTGKFIVSARQLTISATFDLQKTPAHIPFLQMQSCQLQSGLINTHVADVGLLTDSINLKYKAEMIAKAKEMITSTICDQMEHLIKTQINSRLNQMPRIISAAQVLKLLSPKLMKETISSIFKTTGKKRFFQNVVVQPRQTMFDYVHPRGQLYANYAWSRLRKRRRRQTENIKQNENIFILPLQSVPLLFPFHNQNVKNDSVDSEKGVATIEEIDVKNETDYYDSDVLIESEHLSHKYKDNNSLTLIESTKRQKINKPKTNAFNSSNKKLTFIERSLSNTSSTTSISKDYRVDENKNLFNNDFHLQNKTLTPKAKNVTKKNIGLSKIVVTPSELPSKESDNEQSKNLALLLEFIDLNTLGRAFIDLDFLDSSASLDSFSVGINGNVFLKPLQPVHYTKNLNTSSQTDASQPKDAVSSTKAPLLSLVNTERQKMLEMAFSERTPNLLLQQAHRGRLLKTRIGSKSPVFGKLLKTTCTLDEICFSDSVPELEEKYPNKSLEILLETTQSPKISISKDFVTIDLTAEANFYLENTHQHIGRIPFVTTAEITAQMSSKKPAQLNVNLVLSKLEILDDLDFFDLPAETLSGLRNGVKGALENEAKRLLLNGVDMRQLASQFRHYGLDELSVKLLDNGVFLLQANVDVYQFVFETNEDFE